MGDLRVLFTFTFQGTCPLDLLAPCRCPCPSPDQTALHAHSPPHPAPAKCSYISFMTTPGSHNDTYAESFHRDFFR
jgi:hypothetical protein